MKKRSSKIAFASAAAIALFFVATDTIFAQSQLAGRWQCSCGSVWDLSVNGSNVSGNESGSGGNGSISGTVTGNTFSFQYRRQDGVIGSGSFVINGNSASGTIYWNNGTRVGPSLTKITSSSSNNSSSSSKSPFHGNWKCSCGSTWYLTANGSNISGYESGSGGNGTVSGTVSGNTFSFQYRRRDGVIGSGSLVAKGNSASGTIYWNNGTRVGPSLTKITSSSSNTGSASASSTNNSSSNSQSPFHGNWKCSCGSTWYLTANGSNISGYESGSGGNGNITGTWSGNQFKFQYRRRDGVIGSGTLVATGNSASGNIRWNNGTYVSPMLTKLSSASRAAAGWYPVQYDPNIERYWDGQKWTQQTRPKQ